MVNLDIVSDEALNIDLAWFALSEQEKEVWFETHPLVGPLLPEIFNPIRIGARYRRGLGTRQRADGSFVETPISKKDRRVARKLVSRGRVERTLDSSAALRQRELKGLGKNSHERKRLRELLAKIRRSEREAQKIVLREAAERLAQSSSPTSPASDSSDPSSSTTSES